MKTLQFFIITFILFFISCDTNKPPKAYFEINNRTIKVGEKINFKQNSSSYSTKYKWSFPGGVPSSSTSMNQQVIYNSPGTYDVTLTMKNKGGESTMTRNSYITVKELDKITISTPNSSTSWETGDSHNINWTSNFSDDVTIELYKGYSFETTIAYSTSNDGEYYWTIPDDLDESNYYHIKISGGDNASDESDDFTIEKGMQWISYNEYGYWGTRTGHYRRTKFDNYDFSISYPIKIEKVRTGFYYDASWNAWTSNYYKIIIWSSYSTILYESSWIYIATPSSSFAEKTYTLPYPKTLYDDFYVGIYVDDNYSSNETNAPHTRMLKKSSSGHSYYSSDGSSWYIHTYSDGDYFEYNTELYIEETKNKTKKTISYFTK